MKTPVPTHNHDLISHYYVIHQRQTQREEGSIQVAIQRVSNATTPYKQERNKRYKLKNSNSCLFNKTEKRGKH